MKNLKINLFMAMAAMALTACQKDDVATIDQDGNTLPTEMATVRFNMKADALKTPGTRAGLTQSYKIDGLRILAFRQNDDKNFLYIGDVAKDSIKADGTGKFTGTAQLPVGVYQFIPAFGLPAAGGPNVEIPVPDKTTDIISAMNITHKTGVLPAIFLQEKDKTSATYTLGVNNNVTPSVSLNLKRAVARVDIMFVRGHKDEATGKYVEDPNDISVFGKDIELDSLGIAFTGINPTVQLIDGALVSGGTPINPSFDITLPDALTKGTLNGNSTLGTADGDNVFENIDPESIVKGGAHIYGPFVFPYETVAEGESTEPETTTITIKARGVYDQDNNQYVRRTITVPKVKLARNQVTLVKIFVPGDDLFHTNTTFAVTITTDWTYNNESWGEAL